MITGLDFGEDVFEPISCHAMMVFIKALEDVLKNEDLSKKCGAFYQLQQVQKRLAAIADHMNIIGQYPQRRFLNVLWSVRRIFNLYLSSLDHSDDELSMEQSLVRSHTLQIRRRFDGFDMFSYLYHCLKEVWQLHSTLDWSQEDEENRRRDSECCLRFLSDEHNNDPLNDAYCPVITVLETPEDQATLSSRAVLLSEIYSRCTPNLWNADALHEELTSHRCSVEEENLEPYDDEWSVFNPSCTSHGLIPHFVLGVNWEGEKVVLLEAHTTIDTARRSNGLAESPRSDDSNIGRDECIDSEFQALFFCDSKHRYTWCHPALMLVHGIVQARRFPHLTSLNASELSRYIVAGEACNAAQNLACSIPETVFTNNLEPCACLVMEYPTQNQNILTLEDYLFHKGGIPELTLPRVLRWIRQVCDTSLYLELSPDTLPDEVRAQYCSLCPSHIFLSEKKSFPVPQLRVVPPIYYHMNTRWRPPDSAICPAAYNLALIFMCMWTRRKPWHTYSSHQPLKVIQSLRSGEILPYDIPKDLPLELRVALLRCFMTKKTVTKDDSNVVNASQHALKNRRNRNLSLVAAVAGSTPFSPQLRDELSSPKRGSIRKGGVAQSGTCGNGQNISEYSSILDQVSEEVHSSSKDYRLRSPMTVREFVHILQVFWQENYSNAEDFSENAAKYMNDRMIQSASEYEGMRLSGEDKETELNDWVPRRIPDFFYIQYLDE